MNHKFIPMKNKYDSDKIAAIIVSLALSLALMFTFGCTEPTAPDYSDSDSTEVDSNVKTVTTLPLDSEMKVIQVFDSLKK